MKYFMTVFISLIYLLIGYILAFGYYLLSGNIYNFKTFQTIVVLAPIILFIWFITAVLAGLVTVNRQMKLIIDWRAMNIKQNPLPGFLILFWALGLLFIVFLLI